MTKNIHPKAPKSKTQNLTNRTLACASFLYSPKMWSKAQNPLRISICQFLSAGCIGFQHMRGSKIEKIGKKAKKWEKMTIFNYTPYSLILPIQDLLGGTEGVKYSLPVKSR